MSPEVVEDVKQNMDTDDTRDEVLDVCQPQRELRNSYPVDGCNPSPPTSLSLSLLPAKTRTPLPKDSLKESLSS